MPSSTSRSNSDWHRPALAACKPTKLKGYMVQVSVAQARVVHNLQTGPNSRPHGKHKR